MASPGDKKGQRRGSCAHVIAVFDMHDKCGKEAKAGVLVTPSDVTVKAFIDDREPAFQSPPQSSVHPAKHVLTQAGPSTATSFVTSEQLMEISDRWVEQFARFEPLLCRGNVFSTPNFTVKPLPSHTVVSDTPFIAPARLRKKKEKKGGPVASLLVYCACACMRILLRYNSLLCGTECCSRMAARSGQHLRK